MIWMMAMMMNLGWNLVAGAVLQTAYPLFTFECG